MEKENLPKPTEVEQDDFALTKGIGRICVAIIYILFGLMSFMIVVNSSNTTYQRTPFFIILILCVIIVQALVRNKISVGILILLVAVLLLFFTALTN